jgi:hypothetical protein
MVICAKCMKKQSRKSESVCSYEGNEKADPIHAWMDYEGFINELREKLFPFIRERIEELQETLDRNKVKFNKRMVPLNKKYEPIKAAFLTYLKEGIYSDIEKLKKRAVRPYLGGVIGGAIGTAIVVFIFFKWLLPQCIFFITNDELFFLGLLFIVGTIVLVAICLGKPLIEYLKERRYAESRSKSFECELIAKWRDINGINEAESNIEAEENKYNNIRDDIEWRIYSAERALAGSNEDLLNFYDMDNQTKNYYLEKIYEGAW